MQIFLNRTVYAPGETVRGTAIVHIDELTPRKVVIAVSGREKSEWKGAWLCNGTRQIFDVLQGVPYTNTPGCTYVVPFEFVVPVGVPDSFMETNAKRKAVAEIVYCVSLTADYGHYATSEPTCTEKTFEVRREIPSVTDYMQAPPTHDLSVQTMCCCCCFGWKRGTIKGSLWLNQTAFKPGDLVHVRASISGPIVGVSAIEFGRTVQSSALSGETNYSHFPNEFNGVIIDKKAGFVAPITKGGEWEIEASFRVPDDALSTCMGSIVRRMHYLRIKIENVSCTIADMYIVVDVLNIEGHTAENPSAMAESVSAAIAGRSKVTTVAPITIAAPSRVAVRGDPQGLMAEKFWVPRI